MEPVVVDINSSVQSWSFVDFCKSAYDVIDFKIKELAVWFFSFFESIFSSQTQPMIAHVVTYNAGGFGDYRLAVQFRDLSNGKLPDTPEGILQIVNEGMSWADKDNKTAREDHKTEIRNTLAKVVASGADILCLQEVQKSQFEESGSILPPNFQHVFYKDPAIAWNADKYTLIGEAQVLTMNGEPCLFADLQDNLSKKIIRAASYHNPGYNLKEAQEFFDRDEYYPVLDTGIKSLKIVLSHLKETEREEGSPKPDAIILGIDMNNSPEKAPGLFRMVESNGFRRDLKDTSPSHVNLGVIEPLKFDYVLACPSDGNNIEIEKFIPITDENGQEWAPWNSQNPSDHLPVGARVTIPLEKNAQVLEEI